MSDLPLESPTMTVAPTVAVELCPLDDVPEGLGRSFRIGETLIAVFRSRTGKVFAVDGLCPHKGGPLADGMLVGEQVVCPLHAFRFDGHSGDCDQKGVCAIRTYPTEVRQGMIRLTLTTG